MTPHDELNLNTVTSHISTTTAVISSSLSEMYEIALSGDTRKVTEMATDLDKYTDNSMETLRDIIVDNELPMSPSLWVRLQVMSEGLNHSIKDILLLAIEIKLGMEIMKREMAKYNN